MPARDGTGPRKVGSSTGRGLGRLGRAADEATAVADPYRDCGLGWGYWPRAGGRDRRSGGRGGRGGGRGRGSARARRRAGDSAGPVATAQQRKSFLRRRIQALAEELERVQALLSEYSRGEARDEE
ncbi:MAG: DUF5320 domain-containing protein [Deltaproteobacteria bacterium]|nr:DUF5320 domain-containing protein [Deltaproteobacteria bacterium]